MFFTCLLHIMYSHMYLVGPYIGPLRVIIRSHLAYVQERPTPSLHFNEIINEYLSKEFERRCGNWYTNVPLPDNDLSYRILGYNSYLILGYSFKFPNCFG